MSEACKLLPPNNLDVTFKEAAAGGERRMKISSETPSGATRLTCRVGFFYATAYPRVFSVASEQLKWAARFHFELKPELENVVIGRTIVVFLLRRNNCRVCKWHRAAASCSTGHKHKGLEFVRASSATKHLDGLSKNGRTNYSADDHPTALAVRREE